ncbi:tetratricopeptide repeat protein [Hymenobacter sp. J193]|uniref:tetratricopeptide repeat protein n=1 Tax=Hymenobacter sp. J193 TaxID=2898429 RepID=UPI002150F18C|nr:tetratricopeptide repeat protein [Hymenobacter sp. J193]MCR5888605.1 tetratricopeptide repeat protein [Hymenobacter sp. J193]
MSTPRRILYFLVILGFVAAVAALVLSRPTGPVPQLKIRQGSMAAGAEWLNTRKAVAGLQERLRRNPDDHEAQLQLAQAYMQEGRVTGEHAYYDAAAVQMLDKVLRAEPDNFEALCCKSSLSLTQHHFSEGLALARRAQEQNPHSGFVYGLLCDANVELGNYSAAVRAADRMNQVRPDLTAYSRVSYLREIHGDLPGAVEAMHMAVRAGVPGMEQTEWARVMLGHLYETTGNLPEAEKNYNLSLQYRPAYAYALAGLGRVERARHNYPVAIKHLEKARNLVADYAFTDELTDLYRLNGEPQKAQAAARDAIRQLDASAEAADADENVGHYVDRELAFAYLKTNELDKALKHAEIEYQRRPDNIDVCETMAWVHYKRGEYADAAQYMKKARRTNSHNPTQLCRAGLIALKTGQETTGHALIKQALAINPYLEADLADEGRKLLAAR